MLPKIFKQILQHKFITGIILLLIVGGGYFGYQRLTGDKNTVRYVTAAVEKGTLIVSVSGSGQVSASNQVDITSKSAGDILYLNAKSGQEVKTGTLIAQIDAGDASYELETAKLSYEELTTVNPDELRDAQNTLTQAKEDMADAYITARASLTSASTDMADVLAGVDELFSGYLSTTNRFNLSNTSKDYIERAESSYYDANKLLKELVKKYRTVSAETSESEIETMISESYEISIAVSQAAKYAQDATVYLRNREDNDQTTADEAYTSVTELVSTANAVVSRLSSAKNSIVNGKRTVETAQIDLEELEDGPDTLELRSEEFSLRQKQEAYEDYFIRAPFDGTIASVDGKKGQNVSSGATIATLITKQKIAEISLNEVDAAKVKIGQKTTLTFDALPDLSISGKVIEVDTMGTVTQGVVSYGVKIALDAEEERIRPGMSVTADIITEAKQDVLVLPNSAIKSQGNSYYVELVEVSEEMKQRLLTNTSGTILPTPPKQQQVETGLSNDLSTEIVSGLKEGDIVVTSTISPNKIQTTQTQTNQSRGNQEFQIPGL